MQTTMYNTWEELEDAVNKCERCNLCKNRQNVVISKVNRNSKIMIIGDFSYFEDDKTGKPLSGSVGELFKRCLEGNEIEEKDMYMANILKCKNELYNQNAQQTMQICMSFLRNEVSLLRPKIIILLGNIAVKNILGQENELRNIQGKWIEKKGVYFMATWHPLDVIRDENKKIELWKDIKQAKEKLKQL